MSNIIIFPTDTVYGIGCPIFDTDGIKKIYEIKNRSTDKPLACLCSNLKQIESIAYVDEKSMKLIRKFMPGGLTLILKSKEEVFEKIGYKTIGVRIPDSKIAIDILNKYGPMLTTSVNESGKEALNDYKLIRLRYGSMVDAIYPPINTSSNVSSTVIDCSSNNIKVLREGTISINQIKNVLNV